MGNRSPSQAFRSVSLPEWIVRREESMKRIGALLAERRMTVSEVAQQCGLKRDTAYRHLSHMEELGLAHRTGVRVANGEYWAAGVKPASEAVADEAMPTRARTEVVVQRHWMDVALFGPARQEVGRAA